MNHSKIDDNSIELLSKLEQGENMKKIIFIGTHGKVYAYDISQIQKPTVLWKTKLHSYHFNIITLCIDSSCNTIHATASGVYFKLNMSTGEVTYRWEMSNMKAIYSVLAFSDDMVITNSIKKVYAMRKKKGTTIWRTPYLGRRYDAIQVFNNVVLVGASNSINCIDLISGNILWRDTLETEEQTGITLLCDENRVFVGHNGFLYQYDIESGHRSDLLRIAVNPEYSISLLIHDNVLFAAAEAKIYAFRLNEWENPIWTASIKENVGFHAAISLNLIDNSKLIVGSNGFVVALNTNNGETCWIKKIIGSGYSYVSSYVLEGRLLVGSSGKLAELNHQNGDKLWSKNVTKLGYTPLVFGSESKSTNLHSDHPIIQTQERGSTIRSLYRSFME